MAVAALPGSTAYPSVKGNLCGGTTDDKSCPGGKCPDNDGGCTTQLWNEVGGDTSFQCYSYTGPCSIGWAGGDGLAWQNKDPSKCMEDTFVLWDEPSNYAGKDTNWQVATWKLFVARYGTQLREYRNRGGMVSTPMARGTGSENAEFLDRCAGFCTDPNSNGYIGVLAINYYAIACGKAFDGADYNIRNMASVRSKYPTMPIYVTNWAVRPGYTAECQLDAMKAAKIMLDEGWRVYWFGSKDCYNGDCNSSRSGAIEKNRFSDMGPNGITMGREWKNICDAYPHSGPSPGPTPSPSPSSGVCNNWCAGDTANRSQGRHCGGDMDYLCGGCPYCGVCNDWCQADRTSESGREARHCSGDMIGLCGGCNYCFNRSNSARSEL